MRRVHGDNQRHLDEADWPTDLGLSAVLSGSARADQVVLGRLRLRFGSPRALTPERPFSLAVDLVDEMAQPLQVSSQLMPELCVAVIHAEEENDDDGGGHERSLDPTTELSLETLRCVLRPSAAQWRLDCVLHRVQARQHDAVDRRLRLQVQLSAPSSSSLREDSAILQALQQFCVASQWLPLRRGGDALVLPVVSDVIHVTDAPATSLSLPLPPPTSSRCQRRFQVGPQHGCLRIQEDYGLAMGAHVWDASIWLGVALRQAVGESARELPSMLELGAGSGLFGCVYRALGARPKRAPSVVLTERPDCVEVLQANLARNGVHAVALPLMWGSDELPVALRGGVDVVFAADVLYNWSVHELWLATLARLAHQRSGRAFRVLLAHKRRGGATSERLDAVLKHGVDAACGERCRWRHWDVRRVGAVSAIDVLQLTPRASLASDDDDDDQR
ncbi:hypothetical protein P43SY_007894 [Pythium insidiosum]|uniref:FAM86 N-terminal domain-containing protein n=1 Tax=Pythium insidiosum TaxID=114742 RepID=A0AAD5M384_PYTIN|nr:hypothetical protein P43SY_007894 [Pythium insidiosum]